MKAAPLRIEISPPVCAVIAQADEIEIDRLHHVQDLLERHFAVV